MAGAIGRDHCSLGPIDVIRFRELALALALCCAATPAAADPATRTTAAHELIGQFGLDQAFARFGASIAAGPRQGGVADEAFLGRWERLVPAAFNRAGLTAQLDHDLAHSLDESDLATVAAYVDSPLGRHVLAIEAAASGAGEAAQIEAIARGQALLIGMPAPRKALLGEIMELSGARMTVAMLHESLRAIALGLRLEQRGGIAASYDEVEAEVSGRLAELDGSLTAAMQGALAAAYAGLTDKELGDYLDVLRQPAMRKFYETITASTCRIIRNTMLQALQQMVSSAHSVSI